jgi:cysteine-rich repeat protein
VLGNCDVNGTGDCTDTDATIVKRNVMGLSPFDPTDPNLTLVEGQHCENAQPGDGAAGIIGGEECEDGNQVSGDGCSSECVIEFCRDEVVQLGLGEDCDPPGSPCLEGGVCDGACACPGPIGLQMCVSDRRSFCVGDDPNGRPYVDQPCGDTIIHSDCPPGPPSARCIGNSGIDVNTALGSPFLTIGLAVGIELDCGAIDPATGRAPCTCELRTAEPVDIPGIGVACMGRLGGCGSGEIDCDGGSPFDLALVHDHDIGPDVVDGDPNGFPLPFCGFLDSATAKAECEAMCDVYCADLAGEFIPLASGCEGFCRAGSREGLPCEFNVDCVGSDCVGGEGVPHANLCGCQCIEAAGNPSRPGALRCEIGLFVLVESAEPCDALDVTLTVANQCVPFTTESFTNLILNSNATPNPIGPDPARGEPVNCAELRAGALSGLKIVGNSTNFDSQLGDLSIPIGQSCE